MRLPTFYEQNLIPNWGYFAISVLLFFCFIIFFSSKPVYFIPKSLRKAKKRLIIGLISVFLLLLHSFGRGVPMRKGTVRPE